MAAKIAEVRAVDPGVSMVLVQQPQTWHPGISVYNQRVVALAAELDTPGARVVVTALAQLDKATETFDALHPTATGEVKVAAAVADALASLGVGTTYPRPLPTIPDGPVWAPQQTVVRTGDTVTVTWPVVDYASKIRVEVVDESAGADVPVADQRWTMTAVPGHRYRLWLRPIKGYVASATHSVASVLPEEVKAPEVARVGAGPRPSPATRTAPAAVRWSAARGAAGYSRPVVVRLPQ